MHPSDNVPDPLFWGTPIRFCETFYPLGSVLQVESNEKEVIEAARESFGRYAPLDSTTEPDYCIRLLVDPVHHQSKPWPQPNFRASDHLFHVSCGETSFAIADLDSLSAVGFVTEELIRDTSFFRNAFLECLFYVLATHHTLTPVHCAGVAIQGRGAFICGPSGAGKTSLAYACVRAGMQVLSDDVVHVRSCSESPAMKVWGRPWHLRLLPNAADLFPELSERPVHLRSDYELYMEIDIDSEFPGQAITSCTPAVLVFLERGTTSQVRLEPMESGLALQRMGRDIYLTSESVRQRHLAVLAKLAETRSFLLRYGTHPSTAVEAIAGLIE
jgi:hypothetical protein